METMPPTPSPRRRRATREQTRERLLDAAEEVFAARGLDAASLDEVALAAGLTKGAVYSNFPSKNDLVLALMEDRIAARTEAASAAFAGASVSTNGVHEAGTQLLRALRDDAVWQRLFLDYWSRAVRDPELRAGLADRRRELRCVIVAALKESAGTEAKTIQLPLEQLAVVLLALSNGLAIEAQIDPATVPDDMFGNILALLVR